VKITLSLSGTVYAANLKQQLKFQFGLPIEYFSVGVLQAPELFCFITALLIWLCLSFPLTWTRGDSGIVYTQLSW